MNSGTTYYEENMEEDNEYQEMVNLYKSCTGERDLTDGVRVRLKGKVTAKKFLNKTGRYTHFALFDSGVFNYICKGYILMALNNTGVDRGTRKRVMGELNYLFDIMDAEKAERYYTEY